jgi:hypothetical protein
VFGFNNGSARISQELFVLLLAIAYIRMEMVRFLTSSVIQDCFLRNISNQSPLPETIQPELCHFPQRYSAETICRIQAGISPAF